MYYLSACNIGLFKSYYCHVLFLPFEKSLKYYEKYLKIRRFKTHEKIYFPLFSLTINNRGETYILKTCL